jgi:manganese transport protein
MFGPALVAAVAYIDPGNFATNIQGGSEYGYLLMWVVLAANAMAMVIQFLSAKLGATTGQNLPELCRQFLPRSGTIIMWLQAELMAIATDVAEIVGAALGLNLLFGVPMIVGGSIAVVIAFLLLSLESRGFRRFELVIGGLLLLVALGIVYETCRVGPNERSSLNALVPHFAGGTSVLLAAGIVGATVMPHAIYLHSDLAKRHGESHRNNPTRFIKRQQLDVAIGLGAAGLVNLALLAVAAKLFHHSGSNAMASLGLAHARFAQVLGGAAALAFALTLFASGVSSSAVGTYAGQVVMQGFIGHRTSLTVRRAITVVPAILLMAIGVNATETLVATQVVLSLGIPFALVPLVLLTSTKSVMGSHVNRLPTVVLAGMMTALIVALNVVVVAQHVV